MIIYRKEVKGRIEVVGFQREGWREYFFLKVSHALRERFEHYFYHHRAVRDDEYTDTTLYAPRSIAWLFKAWFAVVDFWWDLGRGVYRSGWLDAGENAQAIHWFWPRYITFKRK